MARKIVAATTAAALAGVALLTPDLLPVPDALVISLRVAGLLLMGIILGFGLTADPALVAVSATIPAAVSFLAKILSQPGDAGSMWPFGALLIAVWAFMVYGVVAVGRQIRQVRQNRS